MASSVLMTVSRDEEERARIMRDEKIELDYQSMITNAKWEGIEEGVEKGIGIGRVEGIGIGREEGIGIGVEKGIGIGVEKGRVEERKESREYFMRLLDEGLSADEIKQRLEQNK